MHINNVSIKLFLRNYFSLHLSISQIGWLTEKMEFYSICSGVVIDRYIKSCGCIEKMAHPCCVCS